MGFENSLTQGQLLILQQILEDELDDSKYSADVEYMVKLLSRITGHPPEKRVRIRDLEKKSEP